MANDGLKRQHERAAGERLLAWLKSHRGSAYAIREQPDPPKPDLIIGNEFETIGLEVVTAYYSEQEAAQRWQWAREEDHASGMSVVDPDGQLREFVEANIGTKCQKRYVSDGPIWLLVDSCPPLTTERHIDDFVPSIRIPSRPPFAAIYLGVELPYSLGRPTVHEGSYWVWQIYPQTTR